MNDDVARQPPANESLLGRVFDSYQNMMQIAACLREAGRQRSISQPLVLELSRRETGLVDYIPEARITRHATHDNNQPALSLPVTLPYQDKSFDSCLITDVYEHIPAGQRPGLLSEMLRVTNGLVLIGSPQGTEIVNRFDRIVFDFIWGKYAERFEPLEQHMNFGLEPLEHTLESLKALGADRVAALPCNYVYRWIHQILIFFDLQYKHTHWDLFGPLNRIYNERLSPYDYREPCYRYLILVPTSADLDLDMLVARLKAPGETPALVSHTDGVLVQAFREIEARLADELRTRGNEIDRLHETNRRANEETQRLNSMVEVLSRDNESARSEIEYLNSIIGQLRGGNEQRSGLKDSAPPAKLESEVTDV